jgi:chorismate mutase/prephenate dehydrogenase
LRPTLRTSEIGPLATLRGEIDAIDDALLAALARRREVVKALGEVKGYARLPAVDFDREEQMRARRLNQAMELNLPTDLVEKLYAIIIAESRLLVAEHAKPEGNEG